MAELVAYDHGFKYELHTKTQFLNVSGDDFNDRAWIAAMHKKIYFVRDFFVQLLARRTGTI